MNSETNRKLVVGGCMAAAVAIGIVVFSYRHHGAPLAVQQPALPPPPVSEQLAPTPPPVAQSGDSASQPEPADSAASRDAVAPSTAAKTSATPVQQRTRPVKPSLAAADTGSTITATPDVASGAVAPPTVSDSNTNDATGAATPDATTQDASKPSDGADYASLDRQITIDVKSEISRDGSSKDAAINVTTDHGVVALSGSVPDQSTFDHVKEVASRVKGVASVDTSALSVTSLMSAVVSQ